MLSNLMKVALRTLKRQKFFSLLQLLGLTTGLLTCLLITLYSWDELSYDQFHAKIDRIYRINQTFIWGDDDSLFGSTGPAVMNAIKNEVPEFESMTRVHTPGANLVSITSDDGGIVAFQEDQILAVDSNFLEVFTFPLIAGNPNSALIQPNSVVLTRSVARKYFGHDNVIGREIQVGEVAAEKTYSITGIAEDLPKNSHIQFKMLLSMASFPRVKRAGDSWMWTTFVTFGVLQKDTDPTVVSEKVSKVPGKYLDPFLQKYRGISYEEFLESGEEWNLYIQPFVDIHLKSSQVYSRLNEVGNIQTLYIIWLIGGLVLVLSLINFINLSTALASSRAKEVGIRKVIGSAKKSLVLQFLIESFIVVTAASLVAFICLEIAIPFVNQTSEINLDASLLFRPWPLFLLGVLVFLFSLLAGVYPAFYLSSFRSADVLKGASIRVIGGSNLRNILVTIQFAISIMMIGCTLIIYEQMHYWNRLDLGFDRENKLIVENAHRLGNAKDIFRNELLQLEVIESVTYSSDAPPLVFDFDNFEMKGIPDKQININYVTADEQFTEVFKLELKYGRPFKKDLEEKNHVLVNEYLTKSFGYKQPQDALNESLLYGNESYTIVGIINNLNTSLSSQTFPFAVFHEDAPLYSDRSKEFTLSLKPDITTTQISQLITQTKQLWQEMSQSSPFSYSFVDQEYKQVFKPALLFGKVITSLTLIAIMIACLGLIGLVAFVVNKRNKEIGIRKVLGASITSIWVLLSKDFGKLLAIGFLIGTPLSWYIMSKWIENYALRDEFSIFTFVFAGGIMALIAMVSMSIQTMKAARINPVDYLKGE